MQQVIFPNLTRELIGRNLSYAKLAAAVGMSKSAMYRRLGGKSDWKLHEVVNICQYLNVDDAVELFLRLDTKI